MFQGLEHRPLWGANIQPTETCCFHCSGVKSIALGTKHYPIKDERFNILTISGTWLSQLTTISNTTIRNSFTEKTGLQTSM